MDDTTFLANAAGPFSPGDTLTNPDTGTIWTIDQNGNPYVTTSYQASPDQLTIPNMGTVGMGPGDTSTGAGAFNLGTVAQGIAGIGQVASALQTAAPRVVAAIQSAKNAATAVQQPTLTQQWLSAPLEKQLLYAGAAILLIWFVVKNK